MTAGWRFESLHEWPSIISSSGVHRPMRRYARRRFPRAEPFGDARGLGRNTMRARRLPKLPVRSFTDAPHPRAVQRITDGPAVEIPAVGGLHHRYERQCGVIRLPRETRHSGAAPHKHHRRSGFPCRPRACSVSATTLASFSITRRRGAEPVELRSLTLRRILARDTVLTLAQDKGRQGKYSAPSRCVQRARKGQGPQELCSRFRRKL